MMTGRRKVRQSVSTNFDNSRVHQMRELLDSFDFGSVDVSFDVEEDLEHRTKIKLENKAVYEGQWIQGKSIR